MRTSRSLAIAVLVVASGLAGPALAGTAWDEAVDGDFSNNGLIPTPVPVIVGANLVLGTTGNSGTGVDRDYLSFTVPEGAALSSIFLLDTTTVSGSVSFIGIQAGPQLTVTPSGGGAENLLGFAHYGTDQIGQDILPAMAIGFTGALPSGAYSLWVQELGGPVNYGFDFVISAVPEPGSAALMVAGLLCLGAARPRRRCQGSTG